MKLYKTINLKEEVNRENALVQYYEKPNTRNKDEKQRTNWYSNALMLNMISAQSKVLLIFVSVVNLIVNKTISPSPLWNVFMQFIILYLIYVT